jgi:hypothetical protein
MDAREDSPMTRDIDPLSCPNCGASLSPIDQECASCGHVLPELGGTTLSSEQLPPLPTPEPPIVKPAADGVPAKLRWLDGALTVIGAVIVLLILRSNWALTTPDEQRKIWADQIEHELRDPNSSSRIDRGRDLPSSGSAVYFVEDQQDVVLADGLLAAAGFHADDTRVLPTGNIYVEEIPTTPSFVVSMAHRWLLSEATVMCFRSRSSAGPLTSRERPSFDFEDQELRFRKLALLLSLLVAAAIRAIRSLVVTDYRKRRLREWNEYEAVRTRKIYQAKQHLDAAREYSTANEIAKALVQLRLALESAPDYAEARELFNLLVHSQAVDDAAITRLPGAMEKSRSGTTLFLRVIGTPYAYRADAGADVIRVGRQRRKGMEADGNDLVIRVPASDDRTLRISRHHFEINRIAKDYLVIDQTEGRTQLNGSSLTQGKPVQINSGDRLTIAHVLTLEVSIRGDAGSQGGAKLIDARGDSGPFEFEATVGDMMTEVANG